MATAKSGPSVRARQLGLTLREMRLAKGLSADQVAAQMECSQAKISRIEAAESPVSKADLWMLLDIYGVTGQAERDNYWKMARSARERGWWYSYRDTLAGHVSAYIALESEAKTLSAWSLGVMNGLLQTEDYARAVFKSGPVRSREARERLVAVRMARQRRLHEGMELWACFDETLLSRPIGGWDVLRDQLDHLLSLPDSVTVQVVPADVEWHPGLAGSFTHMTFESHPPVAFIESCRDDLPIEHPEGVEWYAQTFEQLRAAAADPETSKRVIEAARVKIR